MSITENRRTDDLLSLLGIVGEDNLTGNQSALEAAMVDGQIPTALVSPANTEEAVEVLKWASAHQMRTAIRGGGTQTNLGNPIAGLDLVISTARLNQITEHIPADLTIGAQAGANLQMVQDQLEQHDQFLPIDAPLSGRATVGGAVATNASGPLRLQYGPTRDWLIGVKFVLSDGTPAKGGGRVVKNVAGFDMMKIFIGSLGTLGLITEMNFKLMPLPKAFMTLLLTMPDEQTASRVALKIVRAGLFPASLTVLDNRAAHALNLEKPEPGGAVLAVEVRNTRLAVERQVRDIYQLVIDEVGQPVTYTDLTELTLQKEWRRRLSDFAYRPGLEDNSSFALKLATLPTQAVQAVAIARRVATLHEIEIEAMSHVGHGISYITGQLNSPEAAFPTIVEITAQVEKLGGTVTAERVPLEIKQQLPDVWGAALSAGELKLMRGVKQKLDPQNLLNPGRFVARI